MIKDSPFHLLGKVLVGFAGVFLLGGLYIGFDVTKFVLSADTKIVDGTEILYSSIRPEAWRINDFWHIWIIPLIFLGLSGGFGGVGVGLMYLFRKPRSQRQIMANFVKVDKKWVHLSWRNPDTLKTHRFKVRSRDFSVTSLPHDKKVAIVIDPENPRRYNIVQ